MEDSMNPQQLLAGAQDALTARRVFGDPIQADGTTIIPAAVLRGGGGGGGRGDVNGVGFGVMARPAGVFALRNGDITWRPAIDVNRIVLGGQLVAITALLTIGPPLVRWLSRRARRGDAPSRFMDQ
jgi:uncharacterized spore protein YtfJ